MKRLVKLVLIYAAILGASIIPFSFLFFFLMGGAHGVPPLGIPIRVYLVAFYLFTIWFPLFLIKVFKLGASEAGAP